MIDVAPRYLKMILRILKKHIPNYEVRAFGSRVKGTVKKYSDLDLAIVEKTKLPKKILHLLREEFQESDLPFRVEIMDWQAISDEFRKIIETQYEIIQPVIKGGYQKRKTEYQTGNIAQERRR
ncbi:MAG: nucleotidyltransferase domain-containing protein [Candidatus Omnitrophica bacterium]|nr:nucleotidyltransferase domain-containing protein [Candidatus Omnitrophota bacterium]MBU1523192.1 nucleotidyltransferase domain-containing protein [Candidatus Omnitrophota bacterium]MBU2436319.1 nucleotidyltransferase domain-containing protein [Candidatus Omnitrophota bacterium]